MQICSMKNFWYYLIKISFHPESFDCLLITEYIPVQWWRHQHQSSLVWRNQTRETLDSSFKVFLRPRATEEESIIAESKVETLIKGMNEDMVNDVKDIGDIEEGGQLWIMTYWDSLDSEIAKLSTSTLVHTIAYCLQRTTFLFQNSTLQKHSTR